MEESKLILASSTTRVWFVALAAYYVLALYLVPSSATVERFSITYFALVVPAWLYVLGNWKYLLNGYSPASKSLVIFALLAGLVGILRWDIPLVYNAAYLSAMAIVILNSRVYLTITELNWMFLGTVVGSVVVYGLGITEYGFLPGQAEGLSCHAAMNWRISLFRVTAESALFSFVILIANVIYGNRLLWWVRSLAILVAAYFLIYSGVRSIVIPALVVLPICAFIALRRLETSVRRRAVVGVIAGTIVILSVPHWLGTSDHFWENYFLKTKTCEYLIRYGYITPSGEKSEPPAGSASSTGSAPSAASSPLTSLRLFNRSVPPEWYGRTFNRHCSAMYQLSLFAESPMGNREVKPKSDQQLTLVGCLTDQLYYYCESCNIATYWLARAGLTSIPLLLCFIAIMVGAIQRRRTELFLMIAVFGAVSLSWGVMFVPYNLMFLLMLAMPAIVAALDDRREKV